MTLKFGQLIEYSMRNIFLEILCTKCVRETSPRAFFKKSKLNLSLDQQSEVSCSLLLFYVQGEDHHKIVKLMYELLAFSSFKVFLKKKKKSGTSLPVSFST